MLSESIKTNMITKSVDSFFKEFDIELKESYKAAITILVSSILYKDKSIVILSETVRQVNKLIKKHNNNIDLVTILLGFDCIGSIDKYGVITIPISMLLNKLTIRRDVISKSTDTIQKKVLTNAVQTLCISEVLSHFGIPKSVSVTIVNIILELAYFKLDRESKLMYDTNTVFKNCKMSDNLKMLKSFELEKVFLSTGILLIITHIGINIGNSLILVSVVDEIIQLLYCAYRERHLKSFLKH